VLASFSLVCHMLTTISRILAPAASVTLAVVLICVLSVTPCYGGKVQSWIGKDADFKLYKTYQWLPVRVLTKAGVIEDDKVAAPLIREAVNRQLCMKGFKEVTEAGDLQISAVALSESIPQLEALILPGGFASLDYAQPIAAMGRYNKEGTLAINLIITGTKKSAWFGLAKESVDNKPGAGLKKIDKAAANLFKKYPGKSVRACQE
jgi:uncharacterized protein DUF4136